MGPVPAPCSSFYSVMLLFQLGNILKHKLQGDRHKLRVLYVPSLESLEHQVAPPWNPVYEDHGNGAMDLRAALKK